VPLSRKVGIFLYPDLRPIPYLRVLDAWIEAKLEPRRCGAALKRIIEEAKLPDGLFAPDEVAHGGFAAADALMFPQTSQWRFLLSVRDDEFSLTGAVTARRGRAGAAKTDSPLPALIRDLVAAEGPAAIRERWGSSVSEKALGKLFARAPDLPDKRWPEVRAPGLYRREHASLVVRSRTTTVVLDPVLLAATEFPYLPGAPANLGVEAVDAVLISHSHGDHWHAASILHYARSPKTKVIVPRVPRVNFLTTDDFTSVLGLLGVKALAPAWGSTVRVGDIDIDVLPFYGEQPTREAPGAREGLRNWGNCYRFNTPDFSAIVLTDAGADPDGDMADELRKSARKRGPADVVLSSVRSFASPFFGGIPHYFLAVPFGRLRSLYEEYERGELPSTTAGPEGIAQACAAARARYYLPYADGFAGVGRAISDTGWGAGEEPEQASVARIRALLAGRKVKTSALDWNPGDVASFADGRLVVKRFE